MIDISESSDCELSHLTIVIPTYNRQEELFRTLSVLLPQVKKHNVSIVVIDNASEVNIERKIYESADFSRYVKVVRNKINIGMSANLCRCFELCETKWMWMLSDDDLPHDNAVATIINTLKAVGNNTTYVNFSSSNYKHVQMRDYSGIEQFADAVDSRYLASNLLFISSGVYNVERCILYISTGYEKCNTLAPHLAILFSTLSTENSRCVFSTEIIVDYVLPAGGIQWSMLKLFSEISTMYGVRGVYKPMAKILKIFLLQCRWHRFGLNGILLMASVDSPPPRWWLITLTRTLLLSDFWVGSQCLVMILFIPLIMIKPVKLYLARFLSNDQFGLGRYIMKG